MNDVNLVYLLISAVAGLAAGIALTYFLYNAYLKTRKATARDVMDKIQSEVEQTKKEELIKFREEMQKKRSRSHEEFKERDNKLAKNETRLLNREFGLIVFQLFIFIAQRHATK